MAGGAGSQGFLFLVEVATARRALFKFAKYLDTEGLEVPSFAPVAYVLYGFHLCLKVMIP